MNGLRAIIPGQDSAAEEKAAIPYSLEAEQQLLGALLTNNDVFDRVTQVIKPEHFYHPVHARIFEICSERIRKNALASPVTIKAFLENDEGLKELGGPAYLARMASAAISAYAARDYAQMIREFALRRELIQLGHDISSRASTVEVGDDAEEQIKVAEQTLYQLGEQGVAERGFQSFLKAVTGAVQVANAAYQRDGKLSGISTGLVDLDGKMGGLNNSDLIIIAGRPSMGKTSLATNIAFNIARAHKQGERADGTHGTIEGGVVGFFSLEMSAEQLAARILSEAAEVPSERIRSGNMDEGEFRRFVEAAHAIGVNQFTIIFRHILPNTFHILLVQATITFVAAIKSEVILSFLGIGVQDGISWGLMIAESTFEVLAGFFNNFLGASVLMFGLVMAFNMFSDALQDALDPRTVSG